MMREIFAIAATTLALALGSLGCGQDEPFVCPSVPAADDAFPQDPAYQTEADLVVLVETIPGFGGSFVHEDQRRLVVLLVEPSDALANRARDELVKIYGARAWSDNPAVPQKTEHDYAELWRFRSRARDLLGIPKVYSVGIDQFTGVVLYGVEDDAAKACVEDNLRDMDIPTTSFRVELEQPTVAY